MAAEVNERRRPPPKSQSKSDLPDKEERPSFTAGLRKRKAARALTARGRSTDSSYKFSPAIGLRPF